MGSFLFEDQVVCIGCNSLATALTDTNFPASGSFIDMEGIDHGVFLIHLGTLDSTVTFTLKQDTSATSTDIKAMNTAVAQAVADANDNDWITLEFSSNLLDRDNGFHYVTVVVSGTGGSNDYGSIMFLGFGSKKKPVAKDANYVYHVSKVD